MSVMGLLPPLLGALIAATYIGIVEWCRWRAHKPEADTDE